MKSRTGASDLGREPDGAPNKSISVHTQYRIEPSICLVGFLGAGVHGVHLSEVALPICVTTPRLSAQSGN